MAKEMVELDVNFISLVDQPANRKPLIYKSADGLNAKVEIHLKHIRKDAEEGAIYGVVYSPNDVDTQGDWANAETIKKAAEKFLAAGKVNMVDLQHNYQAGAGTVVQSFIKYGQHPFFPDVVDESWCVKIKVADDMKSKMGEVGGLSLAGTASYAEKSVDKAAASTSDRATAARILKGSPARVVTPAMIVPNNTSSQ